MYLDRITIYCPMVVTSATWSESRKLTYQSTPIECGHAVRAGFILRRPLRERLGLVRRIYVSAEIDAVLDGGPVKHPFPHLRVDVQLAEFMLGWLARVSRVKKRWPKRNQPSLEMLEGHDHVWALCLREPPPGWRLIGRFIARDVFVAFRLMPKVDLIEGNYDAVAADVIAEWAANFPEVEPVRSDLIDEFISGVWEDMDLGED